MPNSPGRDDKACVGDVPVPAYLAAAGAWTDWRALPAALTPRPIGCGIGLRGTSRIVYECTP